MSNTASGMGLLTSEPQARERRFERLASERDASRVFPVGVHDVGRTLPVFRGGGTSSYELVALVRHGA
ncbi:MAG: hypothetical protein ACLTQI_04940 [Slackia sp.]